MQEFDIIVDDQGQLWKAASKELHLRHFMVGSKRKLIDYLIRNCGHIALSKARFSNAVHLRIYSGRLGTRAVSSAMLRIIESEAAEFFVEHVGPIPTLQKCTCVDELAALLVYNTNEDCILQRPKFFRQPISLQRLNERNPAIRNLRRAYRWWKKLHGVLEDGNTADKILQGQHCTIVIGKDKATLDSVGHGYPNFKPMMSDALGKELSDQSDRVYGSWAAECMLKAAHYDEPIFELVEADVHLPGRPVRSRYKRLLLPWVSRSRLVVSSSSVTLSAFQALASR